MSTLPKLHSLINTRSGKGHTVVEVGARTAWIRSYGRGDYQLQICDFWEYADAPTS